MTELNPLIWYLDRELKFVPPHFIKSNTPLSPESLFWVRSKISGRYAIDTATDFNVLLILDNQKYVYFEESKDVMLFELRWSGAK